MQRGLCEASHDRPLASEEGMPASERIRRRRVGPSPLSVVAGKGGLLPLQALGTQASVQNRHDQSSYLYLLFKVNNQFTPWELTDW